MCKLETMIESERKKNERVNVLMANLEFEKNARENPEVKARNLKEKVNTLKRKKRE